MNILALDSTSRVASAAVLRGEQVLSVFTADSGLTQSELLLPMLREALAAARMTFADVDLYALTVGPGSFTGVRIGVAAAKGLAWPEGKLCAPCSTLESMAWQCAHMEGEICAVMDARRNQVYHAQFLAHNGVLTRLSPDRAVPLSEVLEKIKKSKNPQILVGDGAALCYNAGKSAGLALTMAPPHLVYQTAWGVARAGLELARQGGLKSAGEIAPEYHRLSQAERERLERIENTKE